MQLLFWLVTPKTSPDAPNDLKFTKNISVLHKYEHNCFFMTRKRNNMNLGPVGPILVIVVPEWMCWVRYQISTCELHKSCPVQSNLGNPEMSETRYKSHREENPMT